MEGPAPGQGGAVHIWLEWIDAAGAPEGSATLDDDELLRAGQFRFERDRRRFVARRAFLRRILAGYAGVAPASIRYRRSAAGKPELLDSRGLAFSTSQADGLAIVAVATRGEVGVDIERVRPVAEALDLARRMFTERESEHLSSLPPALASEAFLRLWTRKEAYVKALGHGLSMPLDGFEVLPLADGGVVESRVAGERSAIRLWSVDVPAGYVATVATTAVTHAPDQPERMAMAS
jgi:4'-phosphopantetheinyl transferase